MTNIITAQKVLETAYIGANRIVFEGARRDWYVSGTNDGLFLVETYPGPGKTAHEAVREVDNQSYGTLFEALDHVAFAETRDVS